MDSKNDSKAERLGAEVMAPPVYYGPVKLVSYEYRPCHGHIYMVNDPNKLPEKAVGVRVPLDSQMRQFLFYAFTSKIDIDVAPANRYWWTGGTLLWTLQSAKTSGN